MIEPEESRVTTIVGKKHFDEIKEKHKEEEKILVIQFYAPCKFQYFFLFLLKIYKF
mgnify:CR=1 FL=1